jgi:hypothetical protein
VSTFFVSALSRATVALAETFAGAPVRAAAMNWALVIVAGLAIGWA